MPEHSAPGPNTRRHETYRRDVMCYHCHGPRWFVFDTGRWVCVECRYVELTPDGKLAPSPWVDRPAVEAIG